MGTASSKSKKTVSLDTYSEIRDVHHVQHIPDKDAQLVARHDIMISYSHQDVEIMRKLKDTLQSANISVWVDETGITPGAAYLRKIGEAIVDSTCFLTILSSNSIESKYCRDEVSLAYISNKTIFAVSLEPYSQLADKMDLGMKLTLACVQWNYLDSDEDLSNKIQPLLLSIKNQLSQQKIEKPKAEDDDTLDESDQSDHETTYIMNRQAYQFRKKESVLSKESLESLQQSEDDASTKDFWKAHFGNEIQIEWKDMESQIMSEYKEMWKDLGVTDEDGERILNRLKKELQISSKGFISYRAYKMFTTKEKFSIPFSEAIQLFAAETFAMQEVFSVSSSVRLSAISNLGKFQTNAVIDALLDLLEEDDPNVRVVAAISLAHAASGVRVFKRRAAAALLACLDNSDRLVRESGCLALGRIKSKHSINKLVALWRNDTISSVREAAQVAISQIGGEEAEQALHVTKILSEEIQMLKT